MFFILKVQCHLESSQQLVEVAECAALWHRETARRTNASPSQGGRWAMVALRHLISGFICISDGQPRWVDAVRARLVYELCDAAWRE